MNNNLAQLQVKRNTNDFYSSPHWFLTDTLRFVDISGVVGECCCGDGAFSNLLPYYPNVDNIWTNDINLDVDSNFHLDATDGSSFEVFPKTDWIITNPPYQAAGPQIVQNAYAKADRGIIMFLRLNFLEGCQDRINFLKHFPPTMIIVFPRYCFKKNKDGKWMTDSAPVCAMIWAKKVAYNSLATVMRFRSPEEILGFHKTPDTAPLFPMVVQYINFTQGLGPKPCS